MPPCPRRVPETGGEECEGCTWDDVTPLIGGGMRVDETGPLGALDGPMRLEGKLTGARTEMGGASYAAKDIDAGAGWLSGHGRVLSFELSGRKGERSWGRIGLVTSEDFPRSDARCPRRIAACSAWLRPHAAT